MSPISGILLTLCSLVAMLVILYGVYCMVTFRDDIVTRYVLRAGTAFYMWLFFCAVMVGLVPA